MADFHTTRWSKVAAVRRSDPAIVRQALTELCSTYWYPIYAFIRRGGKNAENALDLTQEFFARLLEKQGLATADPAKGRFRNYLLGACRHFLANEHDRAMRQKRGGGQVGLSLEDAERLYAIEPTDERTPYQLFERRWALALLDEVMSALQQDYAESGTAVLFDHLKSALTGESVTTSELASQLKMSEGAVRVAIHRMRQRYRDRLRGAIADTVETPSEVDDEIRALFAALA